MTHAGKISHELAAAKAEGEYEQFNLKRIAEKDKAAGDFDQAVKKLEMRKKEFPKKGKTDSEK